MPVSRCSRGMSTSRDKDDEEEEEEEEEDDDDDEVDGWDGLLRAKTAPAPARRAPFLQHKNISEHENERAGGAGCRSEGHPDDASRPETSPTPHPPHPI